MDSKNGSNLYYLVILWQSKLLFTTPGALDNEGGPKQIQNAKKDPGRHVRLRPVREQRMEKKGPNGRGAL